MEDSKEPDVQQIIDRRKAEAQPKIHSWLSTEAYVRKKEQFIAVERRYYEKMMKESGYFDDLEGEKMALGGELLARFAFGAKMVDRRFGSRYRVIPIGFDESEDPKEYTGMFAFMSWKGGQAYGFNVDRFKRVLRHHGSADERYLGEALGVERIKLGDLFELGGVEEAAHFLFWNEKGHTGRPAIPDYGLGYGYHTSDVEYRGLLWKLAYSKRYMPQCFSDLKYEQFIAQETIKEDGHLRDKKR